MFPKRYIPAYEVKFGIMLSIYFVTTKYLLFFREHVECPVTGCNCCCNGQDSVAMVTPKETDVAVVHSEEPVT